MPKGRKAKAICILQIDKGAGLQNIFQQIEFKFPKTDSYKSDLIWCLKNTKILKSDTYNTDYVQQNNNYKNEYTFNNNNYDNEKQKSL